jgi:hypothetical protein
VQLLREGYSECLFLLTDERWGTIVRKQTKPEISGSLAAEIAWLEDVPSAVHRYFPQVLRSRKQADNGHPVFYDMPYFGEGWVVLSDLILNHQLDRRQEVGLIGHVLQVMFDEIFSVTYPQETTAYPDKLVGLLEDYAYRLSALLPFSELMSAKVVTINGVPRPNIFPLLETIKNTSCLHQQLRPRIVRKVHGDLYPDNILVYTPSLHQPNPQFVMIDPLAPLGIGRGDFAIDIAKFTSWLSAELLALRLGLFSVESEHDDPRAIPAFRFSIHTDDRQLQALGDKALLGHLTRLLETAPWARPICDMNQNWQQRESFYKALYALSMVPLVPAPQNLARFLTGLQHLHDFVSGKGNREQEMKTVATPAQDQG